jgi:hypothetical protein
VVRSLAIALAGLSLLPAVARAAPPYFGFSDQSVIRGEITAEAYAALLERAGADSARMTIEWEFVQSRGAPIALDAYDELYYALLRRGVRPLIAVMGAPRWAWQRWALCFSETCHIPPDRARDDDWAQLLETVARHYPAAVAIEVWNEPNLRLFYGTGPDPARYVELLEIAYRAVKRVDPGMPVLGGALAPARTLDRADTYWGVRPFLRAMYAHGAGEVMDGISLHPYPLGLRVGGTYEAIDQVLATRDAAGDDAALWLTEVGISTTNGFTPLQQAHVLADLVPRLLRRPDVKGVYLHTLLDPPTIPRTDREAGYGLLRAPGLPKPGLCAVATAVGAGAGCTPVEPPTGWRAAWDAQEALQAALEQALAHRRDSGSFAGLEAADLGADPARLHVAPSPRGTGVRLCNSSATGHSFCIDVLPGAEFRFKTAEGPIAAAAAAPAAPDGPAW